MPTLAEMKEERSTLVGELKLLGAKFEDAGKKWPSKTEEQQWENGHARLEVLNGQIKLETAPVNPLNIGLPDGEPGLIGGRRVDGSLRSGPITQVDGDTEWLETPSGQRSRLLRPSDSMAAYLRHDKPEVAEEHGGISFGSYMRAMVTGPKTLDQRNALVEGTDSAGGYTVPTILSAQMIDAMRAKSRVIQAGASTVNVDSNEHSYAKILTDPTPGWREEAAAVAESQPTFGKVTFEPKSLAVMVKASRELLEDSINVERALMRVLGIALSQELDRVALAGSGTDPEPRGVLNLVGLETIGPDTNPGPPVDYGTILDAVELLETANFDGPFTGIMHPRSKKLYNELTDTTGQPLRRPPSIEDVAFLTTSKMPTNEGTGTDESSVVVGDWSNLVIGIRSRAQITILKERYMDTNTFGFFAHLRADIGFWHEAGFVRIEGLKASA